MLAETACELCVRHPRAAASARRASGSSRSPSADPASRETIEPSAKYTSTCSRSIEDFVRQAETEVSDRIVELARGTADRMERRLRDVARAAEAQGEVAGERLRHVSERLDAALAAAEQKIAAYEDEVDVRLDAKLGNVERAVRSVERNKQKLDAAFEEAKKKAKQRPDEKPHNPFDDLFSD